MKKLDVYLQEIKRQKISVDDLQHAAEILAATPQLPAELENPDLTRVCWNRSKSRMKNRQPESGNFSRRNIRDGNSGL